MRFAVQLDYTGKIKAKKQISSWRSVACAIAFFSPGPVHLPVWVLLFVCALLWLTLWL